MKIFKNTAFWNTVYFTIFGAFLTHPLLLLILSAIVSIHTIFYTKCDGINDDETPMFILLGLFGIIMSLYYLITDNDYIGLNYKNIKHKILVKLGKRIPDNWDNYDE